MMAFSRIAVASASKAYPPVAQVDVPGEQTHMTVGHDQALFARQLHLQG